MNTTLTDSRSSANSPIEYMMDYTVPLPNLLQTTTRKTFNRGSMLNGVHFDHWTKLDLMLAVNNITYAGTCHSCRRHIEYNEIIGRDILGDRFCMACVDTESLPADLGAWSLSFRMKRASRRYPDGIRTITFVGSPSDMNSYAEALKAAVNRDVTIQEIEQPKTIDLTMTVSVVTVGEG